MRPASAELAVTEFVRTLALAWKNLAAYPTGHPALNASLEAAHRQLHELRGTESEVVMGIASDGLWLGALKIDTASAQRFANVLYVSNVALLRFGEDTTAEEIRTFLALTGIGSKREKRKPLWDELADAGVANIFLQPVDYSELKVTDELDPSLPKVEQESLWNEILNVLMAGRQLSSSGQEIAARDIPSVDELSAMIARYLENEERATGAEPEAVTEAEEKVKPLAPALTLSARLGQSISSFVARSSGLKKKLAVQQVVQLLYTLSEPIRGVILRGVLQALATAEADGDLLNEFAASLSRTELVEGLRRLGESSPLSSHALTLLQVFGSVDVPSAASSELLVSELLEIFGEEDIDRFNPPDHRALLDQISLEFPRFSSRPDPIERLGDRIESIADEAIRRQTVRTLLDLLVKEGESRETGSMFARVEALFAQQLQGGHADDAAETIHWLRELAAPGKGSRLAGAATESLARLSGSGGIQSLIESVVTALPEAVPALKRLIAAMGTPATHGLLVGLSEEGKRSRRRRLFDFLVSLGPGIVPEVISFLTDSRWYVVRNMIVLLRAVNPGSSLQAIQRCAHHPDMRVRMEAIKALFALESNPPRALLEEAIHDPDPKLAEAAIGLVGSYGIREGRDPLLGILDGRDVMRRRTTLRVRAIKALGELADETALPRLRAFFTDSRWPWPAREERRAAYESLVTYSPELVRPIAEKGIKSRDREIRDICRRLLGA